MANKDQKSVSKRRLSESDVPTVDGNVDDNDSSEEDSKRSADSLPSQWSSSTSGDDDDDDDDDGNDQSDDEKEDLVDEKEINVDFEALSPEADDQDGIVKLLQQTFLKTKDHFKVNDLAELIIENKQFTAIIKQVLPELENPNDQSHEDDDDDVYGVISLIDLSSTDSSRQEILKNFKQYLKIQTSGCTTPKLGPILDTTSERVCFLINERFVNLSPQLSLLAFEELQSEIKKQKFQFDWLLVMSKVLVDRGLNNGSNTKKKFKKSIKDDEQVVFVNAEEEVLYELCDHHARINVTECKASAPRGGLWDGDDDNYYETWRYLLALKRENFDKAVEKIKDSL